MSASELYRLEEVGRDYRTRGAWFQKGRVFSAVSGVSLSLTRGTAYGLVGGSGSGKTTLARILAGMIEPTRGRLFFEGLPLKERVQSRRDPFFRKVQMIFQNPYHSLDPKWTLRRILQEGIHEGSSRQKDSAAAESLEKVGLKTAYLDRKPAALSGGERQRVAIARALAVKPDFLILDEPTSQLDMSVQAHILRLLSELKPSLPGGMLFITHDLALVSHLADCLVVMASGQVVEQGVTGEILSRPAHPVTQALIKAVPQPPQARGRVL